VFDTAFSVMSIKKAADGIEVATTAVQLIIIIIIIYSSLTAS